MMTASANLSDLSLVRLAQSGERRAFDRLVLKYRSRIVDLAMRYMRNRADAEDATQETFVKAYRGLRHFRCDSAFYTWLFSIASNCFKNILKARRRDENDIDYSDCQLGERHPTSLWELETPEELAITAEIRVMTSAALEELSEEHRTAVTLREVDGLSYQEISLVMSIPVGTVRSRIFRARNIIDQKLRLVHDGGLGRHTPQVRARRNPGDEPVSVR
jgi:RNA polymerase sigma-70 factor, ECF subfamily